MRKDNRGFSLVEMIVVIAIAAILVGASATMVRQISLANTEKAAETIATTLDRERIAAMSKAENGYTYIYQLDDGCYMKTLHGVSLDAYDSSFLDNSGTKICSNSVGIYIDSTSGTKVEGGNIIRIHYTKTGTFASDTNVFTGANVEGRIVVTGVGTWNLSLIKTTGKNYMD